MKQIIVIILTIGLLSCNQKKAEYTTLCENLNDCDLLETLYHRCDSVIWLTDTLKILNSKLDTTIVETGIFTFLQYDYPLTTPHKLICLSKKAVQCENQRQIKNAEDLFIDIIDFYLNERPEQLENFSDLNEYLQYEVNSAILCSYAYEKLEEKEKSLRVLQPYLANVEARNSKIHKRYILLCIDKYGIEKVKAELNNCGKTIKLKQTNAPEKDDWVVNLFGAEVGIGKSWETDQISSTSADSIVRQLDFYKLVE